MQNLNSKGWNSKAHEGFPGKFESTNLSRDNVSREIGCREAGRVVARDKGVVKSAQTTHVLQRSKCRGA